MNVHARTGQKWKFLTRKYCQDTSLAEKILILHEIMTNLPRTEDMPPKEQVEKPKRFPRFSQRRSMKKRGKSISYTISEDDSDSG